MRSFYVVIIIILLSVPRTLLADGYGPEQLVAFAAARPSAGVLLKSSPEIYQFLVRAFSGAYTSVPLIWYANEPQGNAYAENTPTHDNSMIIIRVSSKLCGPDQVAALVYESINAQNEALFAKLSRDAYLGSLSKTEFILGILRLEHKTLKKVRRFLVSRKPFKALDESKTDFYRKMMNTPSKFDEFVKYLHRIKRPEFDIFDIYGQFYDFAVKNNPDTGRRKKDRVKSPTQTPSI